MEERGDEHTGLFCRNEQRWKKRDVGKDMEKYKYPISSNDHLSVAVPLSKCGTITPGQTAKI